MKYTPVQAMRLAIEEAKKGAGFVSPNPLVGCAILDKNQELMATGFHARVGEAHAEIDALKSFLKPTSLAGAHLYVTLEPCAHQGRTPPCAQALAKLPLASVTYGLEDPNPQVAGKGIAILKAAKIEIRTLPELTGELEDLAEHFLMNVRQKRPFVAMKVATSLDGQMALKSGESQWITSEEARYHVQYLRGTFDAVMVGVGTYLADHPKLNSRDGKFKEKPQKAVLLDPDGLSLSSLAESSLLSVRRPEDLFLVTNSGVQMPAELRDVKHLSTKMSRDTWDWTAIFTQLFEHDVKSVLVEGGAFVFSQLLEQQKFDRLYMYLAPKILGAGGGLSWTKGLSIESLSQAKTLTRLTMQNLGPDVLATGRLIRE